MGAVLASPMILTGDGAVLGTFPEILTQKGGNETADPREARLSVLLTILNKKPGTRREQNAWVVSQFCRAQAVQI